MTYIALADENEIPLDRYARRWRGRSAGSSRRSTSRQRQCQRCERNSIPPQKMFENKYLFKKICYENQCKRVRTEVCGPRECPLLQGEELCQNVSRTVRNFFKIFSGK